jgi:apolipoprotein N-acyltransferase
MPLRPRHRAALALLAAAAYTVALPPWNAWPLGWLALAPLFAACVGVRPAAAFALGAGFELACGVGIAAWLPDMLARYLLLQRGMALPASGAVVLAIAGVQTGAACAWLAWASARGRVSPFAVGAAWWLCELARCATPIPFALLAATQTPAPLLVQSAEWIGALGVGAGIAAVNAALAGALTPRLRASRANALALAALAAANLGFGAARLAAADTDADADAADASERVEVALVSADHSDPQRFAGGQPEVAARIGARIREAAAGGARLVLFPELALGGSPARDAALRAPIADASRASGVDVAFGALGALGAFGASPLAADARPTNGYYAVRGGVWTDRYDKQRLLEPGETRGFGGAIRGAGFAPGAARGPLETRFGRLGVLLCSEAMFPALARARVRAGADLLVNPSNDVWFGSRVAGEQQLAWIALRAVELRRDLLRPAANGPTVHVDAFGRIAALDPRADPPILRARAERRTQQTPYARVGDAPAIAAATLLAVDALRRRARMRA